MAGMTRLRPLVFDHRVRGLHPILVFHCACVIVLADAQTDPIGVVGQTLTLKQLLSALSLIVTRAPATRVWDVLCSEDCSIGFQPVFCSYRDVFKESVFTADEQSMDITSAPAVQAGSLCYIAPASFDRRGERPSQAALNFAPFWTGPKPGVITPPRPSQP